MSRRGLVLHLQVTSGGPPALERSGDATALAVEVVERVLGDLVGYASISLVHLGGESAAGHPGLGRIAGAVSSREIPYSLTAGPGAMPTALDAIPPHRGYLDHVRLRLDGPTEALHDRARGAGSFRATASDVTRCRFEGVAVEMDQVLTTRNVDRIEDSVVLASRLGARALAFHPVAPTEAARQAGLVPARPARKAAEEEIRALADRYRIGLAIRGDRVGTGFDLCAQLRMEEMAIDVRGRLTACSTLVGFDAAGPDRAALGRPVDEELPDLHRRLIDLHAEIARRKLDRVGRSGPAGGLCAACFEYHGLVSPDVD